MIFVQNNDKYLVVLKFGKWRNLGYDEIYS